MINLLILKFKLESTTLLMVMVTQSRALCFESLFPQPFTLLVALAIIPPFGDLECGEERETKKHEGKRERRM
ncbi:hypothetical protein BJ165DRAFT_1493746 [Panaeolus papilionaceus]|nr:hypothetical protein BJ165DRAFT_1493746 [Panaeolus papilionaceus]